MLLIEMRCNRSPCIRSCWRRTSNRYYTCLRSIELLSWTCSSRRHISSCSLIKCIFSWMSSSDICAYISVGSSLFERLFAHQRNRYNFIVCIWQINFVSEVRVIVPIDFFSSSHTLFCCLCSLKYLRFISDVRINFCFSKVFLVWSYSWMRLLISMHVSDSHALSLRSRWSLFHLPDVISLFFKVHFFYKLTCTIFIGCKLTWKETDSWLTARYCSLRNTSEWLDIVSCLKLF